MIAESSPALLRVRRRIGVSSALVLAGIAASLVIDETLGGFVTVLSLASLVLALHRLGRTGPA
jgi:hypothetical protein